MLPWLVGAAAVAVGAAVYNAFSDDSGSKSSGSSSSSTSYSDNRPSAGERKAKSLANFQSVMRNEYEAEVDTNGWKSAKLDRLNAEVSEAEKLCASESASLGSVRDSIESKIRSL